MNDRTISRAVLAAALVAACAVPGCGLFRAKAPSSVNTSRPIGTSASTATSSTVVLAWAFGHRMAYVADEDTSSVIAVDLDSRTEQASTPIATVPGPMIMLPDGRLVVSTRNNASVTAYDVRPNGEIDWTRLTVETPSDPRGLALSPDHETLYVTSGWAHTLSAFRLSDFSRTMEVELAREPRAIVASDDGKRVFVSHAVGSQVSVVDTAAAAKPVRAVGIHAPDPGSSERAASMKQNGPDPDENPAAFKKVLAALDRRARDGFPTCQGFSLAKYAGRVYAPEVLVDPGILEEKTEGYGGGGFGPAEVANVAVLDGLSGEPSRASLTREMPLEQANELDRGGPCLLPRAAITDERSKSLLVACQGLDAIVAYDATASSPTKAEMGRWSVGQGPTGMAIDPERGELVVWSQFDRTLSVVPLAELANPAIRTALKTRDAAIEAQDWQKIRDFKLPESKSRAVRLAMSRPKNRLDDALALGRDLFHRTSDERISGDGRACASCHPDGRDDGITWATPGGPRRSILLAGRLGESAPFAWEGNATTVQKHLGSTFQRLNGSGLTGPELDALVLYVKALPGPIRRPSLDMAQVKLGEKIFMSSRTGCATCHNGAAFTDGKMHDVKSGRAFNTPSLLAVGSSGPWFHDGRYGSLVELLRDADGKMGHTKHLTGAELEALEAYVKSL